MENKQTIEHVGLQNDSDGYFANITVRSEHPATGVSKFTHKVEIKYSTARENGKILTLMTLSWPNGFPIALHTEAYQEVEAQIESYS